MASSERSGILSWLGLGSRPKSDGVINSNGLNGNSTLKASSDIFNGSTPTTSVIARSLKHLNPSALDGELSREQPVLDNGTRKRQLLDSSAEAARTSVYDGSLVVNESSKRFKSTANSSLHFEPVPKFDVHRMDTTWCGTMSLSSPSNISHSPSSSIRSLRCRISRPSSRASVLSSKTAALLGQIEKVSTPAQEARRMPMLRSGVEERWAPLSNENKIAPTPPLNRLNTLPSRVHIMSPFHSNEHKKPYWRDMSRGTNSAELENNDETTNSRLCPLFEGSSSVDRGNNGAGNSKTTPILKGVDGSNVNKCVNHFSAVELTENADEVDNAWMVKARGLNEFAHQFALPPKGFLVNEPASTFTFAKPEKPNQPIVEESESSNESDSDESESSDEHQDGDKDESHSDAGIYVVLQQEKKMTEKIASAEDTSTSGGNTTPERSGESKEDKENATLTSISSTVFGSYPILVSPPVTPAAPASVKEVNGQVDWSCTECFVPNKASSSVCVCCNASRYNKTVSTSSSSAPSTSGPWDCLECFVHNVGTVEKCVACQTPRTGTTNSTSSSNNVFGSRAFKAVPAPTGVTFGFGASSSATSSVPSLTTATTGFTFGLNNKSDSVSLTTAVPSTVGNESSKTQGIPITSTASAATTQVSIALPVVSSVPPFGTPSTSNASLSSTPFSFGTTFPTVFSVSAPSVTPSTSIISAAPLLNGGTTTSLQLFGSLNKPSDSSTAPSMTTATLSFGSNTSSTSVAAPFGSGPNLLSGTVKAPLFGMSSTLPTTSAAPSVPILGNASQAVAAPFGATSSTSAPFSFGSSIPKPTFSIGDSKLSTTAPIFGVFGSTRGSDDAPDTKKPAIGTSTPFAFGSTSISSPFSTSASTPSFSTVAPLPAAPPSSFQFGAPIVPPSQFNFGATSTTATPGAPFAFGSGQASSMTSAQPPIFGSLAVPAPSTNSFGSAGPFGSAPSAAPIGGSMFAYNATSSRKVATAKRRLPGRKP